MFRARRRALASIAASTCGVASCAPTVHCRRLPMSPPTQSPYAPTCASARCMYTKKRVVVENRLSNWCKRLWALSNGVHSASTAAQFAHHAHNRRAGASDRGGDAGDLDGTALSMPEALRELKGITTAKDFDILPGMLVGAIWEAYDVIYPTPVQIDPRHALTTEYVNNFFSFIHLMTELDVDFDAVKSASANLQTAIDRYELMVNDLSAAESGTAAGNSNTSGNSNDSNNSNSNRHPYASERSKEASDAFFSTKSNLVKACFKVRNAGSPLYYTWLRHTASMENGLRHLMDFRKTIHFFDVECKKRLRVTKGNLADIRKDKDTAASAEDVQRLQEEIQFWQGRQNDIRFMESAISFLFHDFFSKEYLVMEELTWFTTPPSLLEQIMAVESVHPFVRGLADMKERLQPTHHRHIFAFLHPAVVEEPLIAVQVALSKGISGSVDAILDRPTPLSCEENATAAGKAFRKHQGKYGPDTQDKERVDTAIFYSINSAQSALRGMDMGNMLIKRVAQEVEQNINASRRSRNLMPIELFSTLSPIPGYTRWLSGEVNNLQQQVLLYTQGVAGGNPSGPELQSGCKIFGVGSGDELERRFYGPVRAAVADYIQRTSDSGEEATAAARAVSELANNSSNSSTDDGGVRLLQANALTLKYLVQLFLAPDLRAPWWMDHTLTAALEQPLLRSTAHYLYNEKRKGSGRILDPVGNFHVANGATIYRVNYLGNATAQGSHESACIMVNYWYDTPTISEHVTQYEATQTVAAGEFILNMLKNEE